MERRDFDDTPAQTMTRRMLRQVGHYDLADALHFVGGVAFFDIALTADQIDVVSPILSGALKPVNVDPTLPTSRELYAEMIAENLPTPRTPG